MSTGLQVRETGGGTVPGLMGADRLGWISSNAWYPLFAVIIIQDVRESYFDSLTLTDPDRQEKRERWYADCALWEVKAAQMTDRNLWRRLNLLLVHPEMFSGNELRPLMPPRFLKPLIWGEFAGGSLSASSLLMASFAAMALISLIVEPMSIRLRGSGSGGAKPRPLVPAMAISSSAGDAEMGSSWWPVASVASAASAPVGCASAWRSPR